MSLSAVLLTLGLLALGGLLVLWPALLIVNMSEAKVTDLKAEIERIKKEKDALRAATNSVVGTERAIDAARDLPPLDELGLLLRDPPAPTPAAGGKAGGPVSEPA